MTQSKFDSIAKLAGTLIASVQASGDEPLNKPEHLCALALSCLNGGAQGLRLEGPENIAFIRKHTGLPLVGLVKSNNVEEKERASQVYITATFAEAKAVASAGADIIAIDATSRPRPDGLSLAQLIAAIHTELGKPVWADVSELSEGLSAAGAGADVVSTTLYGYTQACWRNPEEPPDFELLAGLTGGLSLPVVLEGRVWHVEDLTRAFELGAYAVVVGSAITRPQLITRRFVQAIPARQKG
jgi:N-acylglucosamine-6-phosphate 2-epimerase